MTVIPKKVNICKLDNIIHKDNNKWTIKIKFIVVRSGTYIDFGVENNDKDPKFTDGDHVSLSKQLWRRLHSKKFRRSFFLLKKVKILYHGYI